MPNEISKKLWNITRNQQLITASEDGTVKLWDSRTGSSHNKLEPHTNSKVSRPDVGKWVGSAAIGDDWIVSILEIIGRISSKV